MREPLAQSSFVKKNPAQAFPMQRLKLSAGPQIRMCILNQVSAETATMACDGPHAVNATSAGLGVDVDCNMDGDGGSDTASPPAG